MAPKKTAKRKGRNKQHPDRGLAKILFVTGGMSQKEIAQELGISEATIGRWKNEDNWDEERKVQNMAPTQLVKRLYDQCNAIMDEADSDNRQLNAKESDSIIKLSKAINILKNRLDPSVMMEAFMKLNHLILESDIDLAKKIMPYQKELVRRMITVS